MKEPAPPTLSLRFVRLPSGVEKVIDSRCRATIGIVFNPNHGARKLRKAGQSRWLGRRPIVRGVAINRVDHPHGAKELLSELKGRGLSSVRCLGVEEAAKRLD
ncbi:hypothetical protein RJ640_029022 [Escallonia rubra]|uniref:Large ribosomal subunit protein uL2 C-terminal domain-containing protein n=1 Tax=Escallonia rubra TaxID=112253 RepID=A0AA88S4A5_9ASTE|nr:hypothetical protein RJ640_029022 [Escallonia rubra]